MKILLLILLATGCSSVLYYPDRQLHHVPKSVGFAEQEHWFDSKDGTKLYAWSVTTPEVKADKGVIVQFHGNAENISSHYLNMAWASRHGFLLFAFDYRGYGRSDGKPNPEGVIQDGIAALDYARQNFFLEMQRKNPKAKFIVIGQSIGGIIAPQSVHQYAHKKDINLLILEATFASYRKLAFNKFQSSWLTWLFSPIAWAIVHESTASKYVLHDLNFLPVLVIHGTRDRVIPLEFGKDVYNRLPEGKKYYWEVEGADHLGIYYQFPEYQTKIINLINQLN